MEVNKPVHLVHYKEIPVEVTTFRENLVRDIVQEIKEVTVEREKIVEVENTKEVVKEVIK